MRTKIERIKETGVVLFEDSNCVHILTFSSKNKKTGDLAQTWHLVKGVKPTDAIKSGLDSQTNCQGCPLASGGGCYVNAGQAPLMVWESWKAGAYPKIEEKHYKLLKFKSVRFGAYGNPSMLPLGLVKKLVATVKSHTGYFHDWNLMSREMAKAYGEFFMASTSDQLSQEMARKIGLRQFIASPIKPKGSIECLSDLRGIECRDCMLCNGGSRRDVWIHPHGKSVKRAMAQAMGERGEG